MISTPALSDFAAAALRRELVAKLRNWFEDSSVDFWSECDAPDELADIVMKLINQAKAERLL